MSEDAAKPTEGTPKKGKMGLIIGVVIAVVTLVGGSVAGAVLGPKLLGGSEDHEAAGKPEKAEKSHKSEKPAKGEHGGAEGPAKIVAFDIPPVVVDLRDSDGRIRHLKVGMTAELAEGELPEEFKLVTPRAREASLTYLRSLSFEEVSDPQRFLAIKEELAKRVMEAVGEDRVQRMILTDFVVQ